jgi:hypothetical protein
MGGTTTEKAIGNQEDDGAARWSTPEWPHHPHTLTGNPGCPHLHRTFITAQSMNNTSFHHHYYSPNSGSSRLHTVTPDLGDVDGSAMIADTYDEPRSFAWMKSDTDRLLS